MQTPDAPYLWLWAKTSGNESSPDWHPLAYHLLDVAAVAEVLIEDDRFLAEFADHQGIDLAALKRAVVLLVGLHDIGKACDGFQAKSPVHWPARLGAAMPNAKADRYEDDHKRMTAFYLRPQTNDGSILKPLFPNMRRNAPRALADCIAGHHGGPILLKDLDQVRVSALFQDAAATLTDDMAALLAPDTHILHSFSDKPLRAAFCWWLSALLPVADWIGSKDIWFPFRPPDMPLENYWTEIARPSAQRALAKATLLPAEIAPAGGHRTLAGIRRLSPLQRWADTVGLPKTGPVLIIIEDATGAGKTEAAFLLAHRMMEQGLASGFYMAMPTMATANAMYDRMKDIYRRFVADDARPSLILAHGKAGLNSDFAQTLEAVQSPTANPDSVDGFCSAWLSDNRRKALLAQFGAGTIDQALLAVLSARYQSLRLYGLSGKVLVLDEVHAYDAFVAKQMEQLIAFVSMFGGSVILLSATLPTETRQKLCNAFARGLVWRHGDLSAEGERGPALASTAYPQATLVHDDHALEQALSLRDGTARTVQVERVGTLTKAECLAIDQAKRGAAVAIIRSTVADVQATAARLREAVGDALPVDMFHARFLVEDRLAIERNCLKRFGKDAEASDRRGRILVTSQVIEQSLDVDFDCLITDLAPVDLLVQRAGRLWRHEHRNADRPVPGPVLHVISPPPSPNADETWLDAELPLAAYIYNTAVLWQSATVLFEAGQIETRTLPPGTPPDGGHVRALVEAVYGNSMDLRLPDGLRDCFAMNTGADAAERGFANQQLLDPHRMYTAYVEQFEDEGRVMTRLDSGNETIRLAIRQDGRLVPAATALDNTIPKRWDFSELSVTKRVAKQLAQPTGGMRAILDPPFAKFEREMLVLEMEVESGGGTLTGGGGIFRYDSRQGFRH